MSEFINREEAMAAIDNNLCRTLTKAADKVQLDIGTAAGYDMAHRHCMETIRRVPAADVVEVLRGEWVKHDDDAIECSVCGLGLPSFVMGVFFRFCPNCGCSMEVDSGT